MYDLKKEKQISLQTYLFNTGTTHKLAKVLLTGFKTRNWSKVAWLEFSLLVLCSILKLHLFLTLKLLIGKPSHSQGRGLSKISV